MLLENLRSQIHENNPQREADSTIFQNNHSEEVIVQTSWRASGYRELAEVKERLCKQQRTEWILRKYSFWFSLFQIKAVLKARLVWGDV